MMAVAPPPDEPAQGSDAAATRFARLGRFTPRYVLAAIIVLHALLLTWSALANSVALDEYAHLPAGASYLKYRQFGMLNLTPPLLRAWAAAPVVLAGATVPPLEPYDDVVQKDRYWAYAEAFLRANESRYHRLFVLGRLPVIAISCVGVWLVYRWAADFYGGRAALLPALVYALCPNLSAHASLVGTDTAITVAVLAAAYLWWRFCRGGSPATLVGAMVAVGAAHLCKFNAVLLWPAMVLMGCVVIASDALRPWRRVVVGLVVAAVGSVLVFNAGYLFQGTGKPAGEYALRSAAMSGIVGRLPERLPVPFPEQAVIGFDALKWEVEQGFPAFLFGEQYRGSRWYYFPVALLFKLPLATLGLLALALASFRRRRPRGDELGVACGLLVFLAGMIFVADVNLGVRYILPALPFAFIPIGRLLLTNGRRRVVAALLVILAAENLWTAPRYLTFFNLLAGGPSRGQFILNDSNFDWGQGLIDLKRWMNENDVPSVQLAYFGRVDPGVYGIRYHLITEEAADPYIAVSSYYLAGLPHRLPTPHGPTGWFQLEIAPQLRRRPRVAVVGRTIHVFTREEVAAAMRDARLAAERSSGGR